MNIDDNYISFGEACALFGVTRNEFYHKCIVGKGPELFKINGRLFVKLNDCLPLIKAEKEFFRTHITVKEATKKLFNTMQPVIYSCYRHNKQYSFFKIISYHGSNYIDKAEFEQFYNSIGCQPLVKLRYVSKLINFDYAHYSPKFFYLLEATEFYKEVRSYTLAKGGKKFYALYDVKRWSVKNNLVTK